MAISDLMVSFLNETFTIFGRYIDSILFNLILNIKTTIIKGVLLGKHFFHKSQTLCSFLATVCMVNCITAGTNMALLAYNR